MAVLTAVLTPPPKLLWCGQGWQSSAGYGVGNDDSSASAHIFGVRFSSSVQWGQEKLPRVAPCQTALRSEQDSTRGDAGHSVLPLQVTVPF